MEDDFTSRVVDTFCFPSLSIIILADQLGIRAISVRVHQWPHHAPEERIQAFMQCTALYT
jgi:hypothetical protein